MSSNSRKHQVRTLVIRALLSSMLLLSVLPARSQGQISLDGSLGPRGPLAGPNYHIGADLGQSRGSNLFHSFGQFNVQTGESASFTGPNTIANIVGRVTGGQQSFIDGRLRSEIPGANLFLLNPSGVLFGPNASLEVSGSFHVSTADFLRFADGAKFSATLGQESVLTVAPPTAFGFLGNNPAAITVQGSRLRVNDGKTVSVVGGDMTILGNNGPLTNDSVPTLSAPSSRIQLASVASPGEVVFSPLELAPDLQVNGFARLGRIELSHNAFVDASGNGGGSVFLRSGGLRVDGSWVFADNKGPVNGAGLGVDLRVAADAVLANGSRITTDSLPGAGRARDLRVTAGSVQLLDGSFIGSIASVSGDSGNVTLNVGNLMLTGGAQIGSSTSGLGRGGDVTVVATEAISLSGRATGRFIITPSRLFSSTLDRGDAGHITISAPRLTLTGGAQLDSTTSGPGRGGDVTVVATEAISLSGRGSGLFSRTFGSGDAGRLSVSAPTLTIMDSGVIAAPASDHGNAGELSVEAGRLMLTGGASIGSLATGSGKAGSVTVSARESVSIVGHDDQGTLSGMASVAASDPGRLSLSAPTVTIDGGVIGTPSSELGGFLSVGRGGNTSVKADNLTLSGGARINSNTTTDSDGGSITLETGRLTVSGGAQISSSSFGTGRGGSVTIAATDAISIAGRDEKGNPSGLFSNAFSSGDAGRLSIATPLLTMNEGVIRANTLGDGDAGSIEVRGGRFTLTGGAFIDSGTRGVGRGGEVTVVATDTIAIAGRDRAGNESGLFANTFSLGDAGRLSISTPLLTMDEGLIQANATGGSSGIAGSLEVRVGRLMLTGGAQISSRTDNVGRGGEVVIRATEAIAMAGRDREGHPSGLFSDATASGDAGRLFISTPMLTITEGAQIVSGTRGSGRGGEVAVAATEAISITGQGSGLFANTFSLGDAGRLSISTPLLTMDEGLIEANATQGSHGNAGSLEVRLGRLTLTGGAQISNGTQGSGRGGELTVAATDVISIAGQGSGLFANTNASGDAGRLFLSTPLLNMEGGRILARTLGGGNAGDIDVRVGRLTLTEGAQISNSIGEIRNGAPSGIDGPGRGGNLTVMATDSISIAGRDGHGFKSGLFSNAQFGRGNAGNLSISTPALSLNHGGRIVANTFGIGNAGSIDVQVGKLTVMGGAQIFSGTGDFLGVIGGVPTFRGVDGPGQGGDLTIMATESVSIAGRDSQGFRSGLFSNAQFGRGNAGNIFLSTPTLTMDDGFILASTERTSLGDAGNMLLEVGRLSLTGGAQIDSSSRSAGRGGTVSVTATDTISIAGRDREGTPSGLFSSTQSRGSGGNLQVMAPHIQLSDGGTISARSSGVGDAGTIQLQVGETFHSQHGAVTTAAEGAGGGAIALRAGRLVQLIDSELTTSVRGGGGDAGNITLDSQFVVLGSSQIIANAFEGMGGNIRIGAEVFLADPASRVSASSALGIQGTVDIRAPVTSLSGTIAPLPQAFVSVAELLPARCAARLSGGKASSLVVGGREGLPLDPGGVLPSPLALGDRLVADPALTGAPLQQPSPAKLALLAGQEKALPRLRGGNLAWGCSK